MSAPLLSIQDMTHYFGGLKAVSNFTFDVPEGVIYGLIGPNGSGKTTIFNLVTGIYTPTQGKILFEGRTSPAMKPYKIVQRGIARTFQNLRIFGNLSVHGQHPGGPPLHLQGRGVRLLPAPPRLPRGSRKRCCDEAMHLIKLMNLEKRANETRPRTCPTANCAAWRSPAPWPPSPSSSSWTSPRPA